MVGGVHDKVSDVAVMFETARLLAGPGSVPSGAVVTVIILETDVPISASSRQSGQRFQTRTVSLA